MMSKLSRAFARHHAHKHNTQTIAGFDQHVQVGTTKWATSLRNVSTVKNDPYGRPVMSVVVGHKEKQQARAVESMLNRVMAQYPLDDPKVAETIHAFREHVQEPSMRPTLDESGNAKNQSVALSQEPWRLPRA
jgi:hypothetical protein